MVRTMTLVLLAAAGDRRDRRLWRVAGGMFLVCERQHHVHRRDVRRVRRRWLSGRYQLPDSSDWLPDRARDGAGALPGEASEQRRLPLRRPAHDVRILDRGELRGDRHELPGWGARRRRIDHLRDSRLDLSLSWGGPGKEALHGRTWVFRVVFGATANLTQSLRRRRHVHSKRQVTRTSPPVSVHWQGAPLPMPRQSPTAPQTHAQDVDIDEQAVGGARQPNCCVVPGSGGYLVKQKDSPETQVSEPQLNPWLLPAPPDAPPPAPPEPPDAPPATFPAAPPGPPPVAPPVPSLVELEPEQPET
jgi:hypothetical protein